MTLVSSPLCIGVTIVTFGRGGRGSNSPLGRLRHIRPVTTLGQQYQFTRAVRGAATAAQPTLGCTIRASLQGRPQPARPLIPLTPPHFCFKYHSFKRFTHKRYRPKILKIDTAATTAVTLPLQPSPALGASPLATGPFCNNAAQPDNATSLYKEEAGEVPFVVSMG